MCHCWKPKEALWLYNANTYWECSRVVLGMLDAPDSGLFKILVIPLNREPRTNRKDVVDFQKVGMASRGYIDCCSVNWHHTGRSVRRTGRAQLHFKLDRLNIFAPLSAGWVCTCLRPNCKPMLPTLNGKWNNRDWTNLDFLKGRKTAEAGSGALWCCK